MHVVDSGQTLLKVIVCNCAGYTHTYKHLNVCEVSGVSKATVAHMVNPGCNLQWHSQ